MSGNIFCLSQLLLASSGWSPGISPDSALHSSVPAKHASPPPPGSPQGSFVKVEQLCPKDGMEMKASTFSHKRVFVFSICDHVDASGDYQAKRKNSDRKSQEP